jgi:hypothetical protein
MADPRAEKIEKKLEETADLGQQARTAPADDKSLII